MGDYSSVAQAMQGASATPDQSMPSGGTWSQILGHLKDTFGESGLYMTPAAIPLSARDAYNSATTPMDPSEMATPPDAQGNRIPDLSSWQGWKNGVSDLYHAMGAPGLALTGMFAGPAAKTADHAALATAQEMHGAGHAPTDIWNKTGWFQGADGKWKFEIPDNEAKWTGPQYAEMQPGTSVKGPNADFLSHPELRAAYPETADINTQYVRPSNPTFGTYTGGVYSPTSNTIGVTARDPTNWSQRTGGPIVNEPGPESITLHELQHAIQRQEGTAVGGSASTFAKDVRAANDMVDTVNQNLRDVSKQMDAARASGDQGMLGLLKMRYDKLMDYKLTDLVPRAQVDPVDAYKRQAGEVEARNVETRMNYTPEQRAARPPWETQDVPNEQQIVRFGNGR